MSNRSHLLAFLPILVLVSCSRTGPVAVIEKVAPVSGTLTYQGKPLEGFQVTFVPTDGRRAATGMTSKEGKFTLGTNKVGDGAPPGSHKVTVVWVAPEIDPQQGPIDNPTMMPKAPVKLPAKYANPDSSGLTQEVPSEGIRDLKLDLQ